MVSYAHGTTGVAARCAPTRIPAGPLASATVNYVVPELNSWLRRGYAVVRTDYEGLGVPGGRFSYLIGHSEARGVLDIVRAADAMGVWGVSTIEHHFHSEGYEVGPNPGVLNAYWAAIVKHGGLAPSAAC